MTTNVPKGTNRASATARRRKHDQRTPLPPREESIEAARQAIAETAEAPRYGEMSVAELRKVAAGLMVKDYRSMRKGALLTAILEAETAAAKAQTPPRVARAKVKAEATLATPDLDMKLNEAFGTPSPEADQKSAVKAAKFIEHAASFGWTAEITNSEENFLTVVVRRGAEAISIEWVGGVFQDTCRYVHEARTPIKLRNASAAKARMAMTPEKANEEAAAVVARKSTRARKARSKVAAGLPFDPELATNEEICTAVQGTRIAWDNSISGEREVSVVPSRAKVVIREDKSGRSINWTAPEGMRSVRVTSMVSVTSLSRGER